MLALVFYACLQAAEQGMKYEGFVTIVLTALGVMLAVLAIVIAVAAIWGYQGIAERAAQDARKAAETKLQEHIQSQAIKDFIEEQVRLRANELAMDIALKQIPPPTTETKPEEAAENKAVAAEYPRKDK
jgi:hypothetical protein